MFTRRTISSLFSLLAWGVLLFHSVVPHHHVNAGRNKDDNHHTENLLERALESFQHEGTSQPEFNVSLGDDQSMVPALVSVEIVDLTHTERNIVLSKVPLRNDNILPDYILRNSSLHRGPPAHTMG